MKIKANQLGAGVLLSYFGQGLQILITLFYTPIMLRLLGQSEYGVYQIAYSVVGALSLFSFGFSGSYIKFYSIAKSGENAEKQVAGLNGMFLLIFCGLGLLVLGVGAVLTLNAEVVLGGNLTVSELETARQLLPIMVVNCALGFPAVVFQNYIIAHEKFIALQGLSLLSTVLNPCLTFPLLLMGYGSVGIALILLAITAVKLIFSLVYCFGRLQMHFSFSRLPFHAFRNIGAFSLYIFVENIVTAINLSIDRYLLGKMVGSVAVAVYAIGGQINTLYTSLSTAISSVFVPRVNRMVAEERGDHELSELFIRVGKIQFPVMYLVLSGFVVFGQRFMTIWAGEGYESSFWVTICLIAPVTMLLIQNVAIEIQRAKGLQRYRSLIYGCAALFNLGISILLIRRFGAVGAAFGTGASYLCTTVAINVFYAKRVGLEIGRFWREICRMALGGILPLACGLLLLPFIQACHIAIYFVLIAAFVLLYVISMYFLGLRREERVQLRMFLQSKRSARSDRALNDRSEEEHEPFQK